MGVRHRSLRFMGAVLVAALVLAACGGDSDEPAANGGADDGGGAATATLRAVDNSFDPPELSVTGGAEVTVTFTNDGDNPHTFTSADLGFDSGTVQPGDSATVTFTAPEAATEFVCSIHGGGGMVGEIVPQ